MPSRLWRSGCCTLAANLRAPSTGSGAAALAVLLAVLSIVAATGWLSRDQVGFTEPLIPAAALGPVHAYYLAP